MSKRWFWLALFAGCLTIGLVAWKVTAKPCYACNTQPPPGCSSAMSASTVRYGDQRTAWWNFLDKREDNKMNMYLGANYVHGTSPAEATYQITTSDPNVEVEPELVTFNLAPAGSAGSNDTKVITVPYTKTGTFTVTANPVINKGDCQFPPKDTAFRSTAMDRQSGRLCRVCAHCPMKNPDSSLGCATLPTRRKHIACVPLRQTRSVAHRPMA